MSRRSAPSLNERKHHPAEQQSFCQAPAITQHDQPPLCSSPGAPGYLTPTGGNQMKANPPLVLSVSPGARLPTRSVAAAPAPAFCLPACPHLPAGKPTKGAAAPGAVPQAQRAQPLPPGAHPHLSGRTWCGPAGPGLPPSLSFSPSFPLSLRPASGETRARPCRDSSWGGSVRIICQHLSLPSCSSWAARGQR